MEFIEYVHKILWLYEGTMNNRPVPTTTTEKMAYNK